MDSGPSEALDSQCRNLTEQQESESSNEDSTSEQNIVQEKTAPVPWQNSIHIFSIAATIIVLLWFVRFIYLKIVARRHHHKTNTELEKTIGAELKKGNEKSKTTGWLFETEHDQFVRLWPTISVSSFRTLVLPPECRLVEPSYYHHHKKAVKKLDSSLKNTSNNQNSKDSSGSSGGGKKGRDDATRGTEDNPAKRLVFYAKHILFLVQGVVSFDYVSAVLTVASWVKSLNKYRRRNHQTVTEDAGEGEDEDESSVQTTATDTTISVSGSSVPTAAAASVPNTVPGPSTSTSTSAGETKQEDTTIRRRDSQEEKKEMFGEDSQIRMDESSSQASISFSALTDNTIEPNDEKDGNDQVEVDVPNMPLTPTLGTRTGVAVHLPMKRRDALESYRQNVTVPFSSAEPPLTPEHSPRTEKPANSPKQQPPHSQTVPHFGTPILSSPSSNNNSSQEIQRDRSESFHFFDTAYSKDSLNKIVREVPVPDKNGYILGDEFLFDPGDTPLLVFVNSRSGAQQGHMLLGQLRRLLNPIQVWDLADGPPEKVLESFIVLTRLRILVCGGDGTVSWIISCIEKMNLERWPPIAILPLGTGNDLARIHGWGGGYNNESLLSILKQLSEAYVSLLDRWELTVHDKKGQVRDSKSFTNYLGVGVDAQIALQVHMLRESQSDLFFSRAVNKAWYALFGAEESIMASCATLPSEITLVADGVEIPLPPDTQGIIFLNIDSYAGGLPLWAHGLKEPTRSRRSNSEGDLMVLGDGPVLPNLLPPQNMQKKRRRRRTTSAGLKEEALSDFLSEADKLGEVTACDLPSSCQDGVLDVVSIRGTFHLGQIKVGLSNANLLCQCQEATITLKKKVAVQVDGEPWRQKSCTLKVKRKKDPAIMLHRAANEGGGVETEMASLLDWAEDRNLIDRQVHSILMKEFSRRIESKTRQRRVQSQDNLMLSLKRAIVNANPALY